MKRALLLLAATMLATPAAGQTIAITNGTLAIGDGSAPIEGGTVVIANGRIVAAGRGVAVPAGAQVVDAAGKWIVAGMVSSPTDLSLVDSEGVRESSDVRARGTPFNAALDVSVAVNPNSIKIANERVLGVTRALIAPTAVDSVFAGQGAVIDLGADPDAVTRPRAFQFAELGEDGGSNAGGTRPAAHAMLRDAFAQAQDYRRNPAAFDGRSRDALLKRADAAVLLKVLDGEQPLVVHVERASDIRTTLGLVRDYPRLKLVLVGAAEGWMVAREIAAARVPVIAAALADLPASFEQLGATESNAGRMQAAGVQVALASIGASGGDHVLRQFAGNLVAITRVPGHTGLDWGQAFAAITSGPAEALGMGGDFGSLRPGRRADVVLWDGDPLELSSQPVAVWIDGVAQPMRSRQTDLRDRYLNPVEGALPKAYERR